MSMFRYSLTIFGQVLVTAEVQYRLKVSQIVAPVNPREEEQCKKKNAAAVRLDIRVAEDTRLHTIPTAPTLTLHFLVISEPLDSGSRFAACCRASQGDHVTLGGRLGDSGDFWPRWNSCSYFPIVQQWVERLT